MRLQTSAEGDYTWFGSLCGAMGLYVILVLVMFRYKNWL